jgi:teichuronic acid biosynthesis glycosyltransferase TuaG
LLNHRAPVRISVIVPAYNAGATIDATLQTILAQTLRDIEVIVVDDCSRDNTAALVEAWSRRDARVRLLLTPSNTGGPATPRNMGITAAAADWVAFCDADDLWHPSKLQAQWQCAQTSGADLVCCGIVDFEDGQLPAQASDMVRSDAPCRAVGLVSMLMKNRIATSTVLCRREMLLQAGGFDADRSLVAVEDYDLWLRLLTLHAARVVRLPSVMADYRRTRGSLSRSKREQVRKVRCVLRRHFERSGQPWLVPLALPTLLTSYAILSLWHRVVRGRM